MRNMLQIVGGVAAAGVIATGATALTGAGMVRTGTGADQWIGGKVTQTVTGASLDAVTYTFLDSAGAKQQLSQIDLTVSGAVNKTIVIKPLGTPGTLTTANEWYCTGTGVASTYDGAGTKAITIAPDATFGGAISCITANSSGHGAVGYFNGLNGLDVTVS